MNVDNYEDENGYIIVSTNEPPSLVYQQMQGIFYIFKSFIIELNKLPTYQDVISGNTKYDKYINGIKKLNEGNELIKRLVHKKIMKRLKLNISKAHSINHSKLLEEIKNYKKISKYYIFENNL